MRQDTTISPSPHGGGVSFSSPAAYIPPMTDAPALSPAAEPPARVYLDAELRPHRSLSPTGFLVVMAVLAGMSFVAGVAYVANGAWPVMGFFGLDVALVWIAFRISYRQARLTECVRVTAEDLDVVRRQPSGRERRWRLPAYWTRVRIDDPVRHDSRLELACRGETLEIAAFLPPQERGEFARSLAYALAEARAERYAPQGSGGAA